MVKGYKNRFTSTILSQVQIEQDLDFITKGLSFRALAAIKSYSRTENKRSFTPFYYGVLETQTNFGIENELYQIQEGTEYLNENQTDKEKRSRELYVKMHKDLSELSTKSKFITCDSCSHYIHRDDPDLVVNTIKWVLDEAETHKNTAISY